MSVREGPRFSRINTESLDELFATVAKVADQIARNADGRSVDFGYKTFEPEDRVVGRIEISGRRRRLLSRDHAGIDVHGDGSLEAFIGRTNREILVPLPGETVVAALRRGFCSTDREVSADHE